MWSAQANGDATTLRCSRARSRRASLAYWDSTQGQWGPAAPLDQAQAAAFTVPGLFAMLRDELRSGQRSNLRMDVQDSPPFLRRIVLGPIWQDGQPLEDTRVLITVRSFETP